MGKLKELFSSSARKVRRESQVRAGITEMPVQPVVQKVYYIDQSTITDLNITHGWDAPRVDDSWERRKAVIPDISAPIQRAASYRYREGAVIRSRGDYIPPSTGDKPEDQKITQIDHYKEVGNSHTIVASNSIPIREERRESRRFSNLVAQGVRDRLQAQQKRKADKESIRLLQANNFEPESKEFNKEKALHWAAANGHIQAVEFLLERGAETSTNNGVFSETALSRTGKNGNFKVAKILLDHGVDMTKELELGETAALCVAAEFGHLEVLELLLGQWPDISTAEGSSRQIALAVAAGNGQEDAVMFLLANGVSARVIYGRGRETALSKASAKGHLNIARILLENGADPDVTVGYPGRGSTALMMAVEGNHVDVARLLLEWGADVDCPNWQRQTALHVAASAGYHSIVVNLLEKGADATVFDVANRQPLYCAIANGKSTVVETLFATKTINNLAADVEGVSCLQRAIEKGHLSVIRVLAEHGVDVKSSLDDPNLGIAAKKGNLELVRVLLDIGIFKEARDERGRTALHLAAENGHKEVVELLLGRGASCIAKNKHGTPAAYWAKQNGHHEIAQLLERHRKNAFKSNEAADTEASKRVQPVKAYTGWGSGGVEKPTKWEKEGYTDPMILRWA